MRKIEDRTKKMILIIALVVFCIALILGGIMIHIFQIAIIALKALMHQPKCIKPWVFIWMR